MARRQRVRRAVALVAAAALVAGFVLYRAGLLGPVYMSASKNTFVFPPETPPAGPRD